MLKQRIITAVILAPLVLAGVIWLEPGTFAFFALLVILLGAWEWSDLTELSLPARVCYLAVIALLCGALLWFHDFSRIWLLYLAIPLWLGLFWCVIGYPATQKYWTARWRRGLLGAAILISAWVSLVQLKQLRSDGALIILLMLIIWSADIGAYFTGKAWGRVKLAPQVSPGKTWEGVLGGMLAALLVCWLAATQIDLLHPRVFSDWLWMALLALISAAVSVLGDLVESMIKRLRGVKDSGRLLPGHGGVLDRIDSLVAGLPFYTLLIMQIRA
mgnify:CR=1 FL=1